MLAVLRGIAAGVAAENAVEKTDIGITNLPRHLANFVIILQQHRAAFGDAMLVQPFDNAATGVLLKKMR